LITKQDNAFNYGQCGKQPPKKYMSLIKKYQISD